MQLDILIVGKLGGALEELDVLERSPPCASRSLGCHHVLDGLAALGALACHSGMFSRP